MDFAKLKIDTLAFANRGAVLDAVIDTLIGFGQEALEDRLRIPPMEYSPSETTYLPSGARRVAAPTDYLELKYLCFTNKIPAPVNGTHTSGAGTLIAGTYYYRVSAINENGETLVSTETSFTLGAPGGINVNWNKVAGATGYKIYGRTTGAQQLIATVGDVATYLDGGSITPAGSLPQENTTGTVRYKQARKLDSQDFVNEVGLIGTDNQGRPLKMAWMDDFFYFDKYADQNWVYELRYYRRLAGLSDTSQTNWWTNNADKALLYAVLAEAGDFLEDEPMKKKWESRRDREIYQLEARFRDEAATGSERPGSINVF